MADKNQISQRNTAERETLPRRAELVQVFLDAGVEMEPDLEALLSRRDTQTLRSVR